MDRKDIADTSKLVKEYVRYSFMWGSLNSCFQQDHIWLRRNKSDEKSLWVGKIIEKLLLIVIVADPR